MKCFICNADQENFTFNRDHGDIDPCGTCKEVIANVFGEEGDADEVPETFDEEVEPTIEELMAAAEEEYYP